MPDITITFDDGKQHVYQNVPDTVAPADVYGRAQKDFPNQKLTAIARGAAPPVQPEAPAELRLSDVPGKALLNLPASAGKFAGGIYEAVTSPVQTAKSLVDLAAGGMRAGVQALSPDLVKFIDQIDNPETTKRISDTASAVGGQLAADYGSYEAIKQKVATDPVGAVADLSTILTGGAMATARAAPKVSNVMASAAGYTDPLSLTIKGGVGGVNAFNKMTDVALANAPAVGDLAAKVYSPFVGPTDTLQAAKLAQYGDLQQMASAIKEGQKLPTLPGAARRTASENLAAVGQPNVGLAGLEASLAGADPKTAIAAFERQQQNIAAIQRQLAGLDEQVKTQAASMTPDEIKNVKRVRDDVLRNLADEERALANTAQGVGRTLPNADQLEVGGNLQARAKELKNTLQDETITPEYKKAFDLAGDVRAPVQNFVDTAKRITENIGALFDASTVPESVRKALRLEPSSTPGEWVELAPGAGYAKAPIQSPPELTLEELATLRRALRRARTDAYNTRSTDGIERYRNVNTVIKALDDDLSNAPYPVAAKDQLAATDKLVETQMGPRFGRGETQKALSSGRNNMPGTLPSEQVRAFMTPEGARQFGITSVGDIDMARLMTTGVLDEYRRAIVDPVTRAVNPKKAAAFEQKFADQFAVLENAGVDVRGTMAQVRADAEIVQRGIATLTAEAKKFRNAATADDVVDIALKSPSDMNFVKQRLTPKGRQALAAEVTSRATQFIKDGAPDKALKYLTDNERTIKAALGKGDKSYAQMVDLAKNQTELMELFKTAPKSEFITPDKLEKLAPGDLRSLETVARELQLAKQQEAMTRATGTKESGAKVASELSEQVGVSPKDMPSFFMPSYTVAKNALKRMVGFMDKKTTRTMTRLLIERPEEIVALAARARAKTKDETSARVPRAPIRPLDIRVAPVGAVSERANALSPSSENRNAMAR